MTTKLDRGPTMRSAISTVALVGALTASVVAVRQTPTATSDTGVLASVRIAQSVLANGKPLPAGVYELRLTNERPTALTGQSPDAERWVEFVANGAVVGRDVAIVLRDDDLPTVGASSVPAPRRNTGRHAEGRRVPPYFGEAGTRALPRLSPRCSLTPEEPSVEDDVPREQRRP